MAGDSRMTAARLAAQRWLWWLAVLVWAVALFIVSGESDPPSGPDFPFKDKVLHCAYFAAGSACFLTALFGRRLPPPTLLRFALVGFLFTAFVGAGDEFHQTFTPGRMGNDPWDWLADVTGGVLGGWAAWHFLKWTRARRPA